MTGRGAKVVAVVAVVAAVAWVLMRKQARAAGVAGGTPARRVEDVPGVIYPPDVLTLPDLYEA